MTPPILTAVSPSPVVPRRHSRIPNTPPVSSTLASFHFGPDDVPSPSSSVRPPTSRPQSQLPQRHHNRQPSLSIPPKLSRSSSTLSLSLLTNNRNAVYIDDEIDVQSEDFVDELAASVMAGEGADAMTDSPVSTEEGVYFNAFGSASQVYLGTTSASASGTKVNKPPTRPPPAPPLLIDGVVGAGDLGGLGGVGVVDEDALLTPDDERDQFTEGSSRGGVHSHHHHHRRQHEEFEETDTIHHDTDLDTEIYDADINLEGEAGAAGFMSRWSLTSSMDEDLTSSSSGGGRLFGSMKRKSWVGGGGGGDKEKEKVDREKGVEKEREREKEDREKEKEKSVDKKRSRLVSFISRISSNLASPPPTSPCEQNPAMMSPLPTLAFWFGDVIPPPLPMSSSTPVDAGGGKDKKKKKDKGKKGKEVMETELAGKDDREDKDSLPPLPIESVEVVAPATIPVPVMVDADPTAAKFNANEKAALLQLKVDTSVRGGGPQLPPKSVPISSPSTSSLPFPDPLSPSLTPNASSSKGLKNHVVASPIIKAFSEGFEGAGSALDFMGLTVSSSAMVGAGSAMGMGVGMRVRSSSAADLLSIRRSGGGAGEDDSYHHQGQYRQSQHRQYQHQHQHQHPHQQVLGQQGQRQGQGQGLSQGQGQARRYASGCLHPQPQFQQSQNPQQRYSSESSHQQHFAYGQQQQRRQSQQLQSYVHGGPLSPLAADDAATTAMRRPGLTKSVSTPMLNISAGYGSVARRDADLPPTPVSSVSHGDTEDEDGRERGDKEVQDDDDDYGVEATHGQWRGGVGLTYDSDRERDMTTRDGETEHQEDALQLQNCEEYSITSTSGNPITPDTPRFSTETHASSSKSSTISGGMGDTTIMTTTHELLVQGVDKKPWLSKRMNSSGRVDTGEPRLTPTLTPVAKTIGSSKGFRGFVERMRFTTTTNSSYSSLPSIVSTPSSVSLSTTATITTTTTMTTATSINTSLSSVSASHSPTASFTMGSSFGGGGSDGLSFLNDSLLALKKKHPKRKLVINGVSQDDIKGYEAVKAWCEVNPFLLEIFFKFCIY